MPKTMKQPRKDVLREQLALAAEEIIRLKTHNAGLTIALRAERETRRSVRSPWWRRLLAWVEDKGRLLCP